MHHRGKYSQHSSIIWSVWLNGWLFVYDLAGCGFEPHCCQLKLQIWRLLWGRILLIFRKTIECGFCLKLVRDMIITYSQPRGRYKYSKHSYIIWPVWKNGWRFVYKSNGIGCQSRCCHIFSHVKIFFLYSRSCSFSFSGRFFYRSWPDFHFFFLSLH